MPAVPTVTVPAVAMPTVCLAPGTPSWGTGGWSVDDRRSVAGQDGQDKREAEGHQGGGQGGGEDRAAAAAGDTTAVGSTAADSVGAAETTNEAVEVATANSACGGGGGAHLTAAVSNRSANARQSRVGRHHAGKRVRARIYLQPPAARSCWSCWLREELDQSRAQATEQAT